MPKLADGTRVEVWAGVYRSGSGEPRKGDPWVEGVVRKVDGSRVLVQDPAGALSPTYAPVRHIRLVRRPR